MKKELVLRKFLDDELSESEKKKLFAQLESNKEFKEELTDFVALEQKLKESKTTLRDSDILFLSNFKSDLTGKAIKPTTGNFYHKWKELINNLTAITAISLFFLGGSLFFYFYANRTVEKLDIEYKPIYSNQQADKNEEKQVLNIEKEVKIENQVNILGNSKRTINQPEEFASSTIQEKNELSLTIREKNILTNTELIEKLKSELEIYGKSGDLFNLAITQKRLGLLYGNLKGKMEDGKELIISASLIFSKLNHSEMEAECYGELALLELKSGNNEKAKEYLGRCLKMLQNTKSNKFDYWQDIYNKNFR